MSVLFFTTLSAITFPPTGDVKSRPVAQSVTWLPMMRFPSPFPSMPVPPIRKLLTTFSATSASLKTKMPEAPLSRAVLLVIVAPGEMM